MSARFFPVRLLLHSVHATGDQAADLIEAYEVAAFLAEQSVEKYLKAYWTPSKDQTAPFIHSLTELADGLGVPQSLRKHLVSLTADYTMARYPDAANDIPYEIYDQETAEAEVASAEAVVRWLHEQTNG